MARPHAPIRILCSKEGCTTKLTFKEKTKDSTLVCNKCQRKAKRLASGKTKPKEQVSNG